LRLRPRLAAAVLAAALPLAGAVVWLRTDLERSRVADVLREFAVARMEAGGRERCEADPASFPQPARAPRPPGPTAPSPPVPFGTSTAPPAEPLAPPPLPEDAERTRFWAYGPAFSSANPAAPTLDDSLRAGLLGGADVALRSYEGPTGVGHEALVRMAWSEGPCAFVLVRRTAVGDASGGYSAWWSGVLVAAGVLVSVLVVFEPVVRRIRKLESGVRLSAAGTYESGVDVSGDDEVAALALAFNEAAAEVRTRVETIHAREETLRRFVADTTHDLMTPLTVLQGHLSLLRGAIDSTDDDTKETLRDALREVDYTTSLVANLGAAAKLDAEPDDPEHPVALAQLVERVAARFRPVARALDIELNHAVPEHEVSALGDVVLLEQAVGNLVHNAVRYNRPGGHVTLVLRRDGASFQMQVEDDGPGVPADELERLAERGRRGAAARSRTPGGKGIGLDITRRVCERHGFELAFGASAHGGLSATIRGSLGP
jgi:signal transduction histidine kinase